jgi:hypothetical protein
MGQFFGIEEIKLISKASQTTVAWESGSTIRIGGQGYTIDSTLVLDLATDIDTGSVAAGTRYYIYAVAVGGSVSLKYSLSDTIPTGYNAHRILGDLLTDATPEIFEVNDLTQVTNIREIKVVWIDYFSGGDDYNDFETNPPLYTFTKDWDECIMTIDQSGRSVDFGSGKSQRIRIDGTTIQAQSWPSSQASYTNVIKKPVVASGILPSISSGSALIGRWDTSNDYTADRRVRGYMLLIDYV